jgi:threonine aldolase
MAKRLAGRIAELDGIRLMHPVEANAVFVEMPSDVQARVRRKGWRFHTFLGEKGCRLMCAWDTLAETVDRFADDVAAAFKSRRRASAAGAASPARGHRS